jgi:hypothetical protein
MNALIHFNEARTARSGSHSVYRIRPAPVLFVSEAPAEPESVTNWKLVHERVVALGVERAAREHELCRWLRAAERLAVHTRLGFASLAEYADRLLGLRPRQLDERLRVARALEGLPELDRALARGELCWSAVRELCRVATAETEGAWRRWADGRRLREVEQTVAARRPGQRPEGRPDPSLVKHRLRYEVRAETMALFRDLEARVRADLGAEPGGEVDDDMVLYEIARRALGGPSDEGRASYQVAVSRCPECLRVTLEAGGQSHEVEAAVGDMVACDCQELGRVDGGEPGDTHVGLAEHAHTHTHVGPSENAYGSTHVGLEGGQTHVGLLEQERSPEAPTLTGEGAGAQVSATLDGDEARGTLGDRTAVRPMPGGSSPKLPRATQTIPPATRRAVLRRDRGRCIVPSCANHRFLDVHHVIPRCEGGTHDPEVLVSLCGSHHAAVHRGALVIEGTASHGFTFRHADGSRYGERLRPEAVEIAKQVLGALEHLGFPASRARALLDEVRKSGAPEGVEAMLRAALVLA